MAEGLPKAVEAARKKMEEVRRNQEAAGAESINQSGTSQQQQVPPKQIPDVSGPAAVAESASEEGINTEQYEILKQRYKTLQGKYDAEVPRLNTQVRQLTDTVEAMRAQQPPPPPKRYYTDQEKEDFGEDVMESQQRIAQQAARDIARDEMNNGMKQVNAELAELRQREFMRDLISIVPNWERINVDPKWHSWLEQPDPLSGLQRQILLDRAAQAADGLRVAEFFKEFLSAGKPAGAGKPMATPSLQSLATPPSKAGSGYSQAPDGPQGKIYTPEEITEIATNIGRGRYSPERRAMLEKEIKAATIEGRIQRRQQVMPTAAGAAV